MQEIKLSTDINRIELEINHYKNLAGQSFWEIGRRLNHVKEKDLAYGEFGLWLEKMEFSHTVANQMMKVAKEIPDSVTSQNLGINTLYLIATLPTDQKEEQIEKIEAGEKPTVREIRELKKSNKEKDERIKQLENQPPKVIEKEVVPADYKQTKDSNLALKQNLEEMERRYSNLEKQIADLEQQQKETNEKSEKYDRLNEELNALQGKLDDGQRSIKAQKEVYDLVKKAKELLIEITPIPYVIDVDYVRENEFSMKALNEVADNTQRFLDNLNEVLEETEIIEGEIIDD